jgi:hypothetical protein
VIESPSRYDVTARASNFRDSVLRFGGYDPIRRVAVQLPKSGNLAIANEVAGWEAQFIGRIIEAELFLGNLGGTSGSTTVDVKKNGVSILTAALSIAFNAATKRTRQKNLIGAFGEPSGVPFTAGDYFRVDVTAIPGAASADLIVHLYAVAVDV